MKLYATITSERATKGQGGNKQLIITLTCKNEETGMYDEVARLDMLQMPSGYVDVHFKSLVSEQHVDISLPKRYKIEKGEKKKGECPVCHSDNIKLDNDFIHMSNCNQCGSEWITETNEVLLNGREG